MSFLIKSRLLFLANQNRKSTVFVYYRKGIYHRGEIIGKSVQYARKRIHYSFQCKKKFHPRVNCFGGNSAHPKTVDTQGGFSTFTLKQRMDPYIPSHTENMQNIIFTTAISALSLKQ